MTVKQQVIVLCAKLSGKCGCHIKSDTTLLKLNIVNIKLAELVNKIQNIYKIIIYPEVFTTWKFVGDIIAYLEKVIKLNELHIS